jgi:Tfp pilus assembly protein PilN
MSLGGQVSATTDKTVSYDESITTLTKASAQAVYLKNAASTTPFSNYLKIMETLSGPGVSLHAINYTYTTTQPKLTVTGVATTREALAMFRDALEAEPEFTNVMLPIAALAKATDVLFTMDITLATTSTP